MTNIPADKSSHVPLTYYVFSFLQGTDAASNDIGNDERHHDRVGNLQIHRRQSGPLPVAESPQIDDPFGVDSGGRLRSRLLRRRRAILVRLLRLAAANSVRGDVRYARGRRFFLPSLDAAGA